MYEYSLGLALFDYLPIALSTLGLWKVAQTLTGIDAQIGQLAKVSVLLIALGGICKASWKLLIAGLDLNWIWLNHALFMCMAPGFTLLTYCFWAGRRQFAGISAGLVRLSVPLVIIALVGAMALYLALSMPEKKLWFFTLLGLLTLANMVFVYHGVRHSLSLGVKWPGVLFVLNFIGVFVLTGLARVGDSSEGFQWLAQLVNFSTQGCMALAGWGLFKASLNGPEAYRFKPQLA